MARNIAGYMSENVQPRHVPGRVGYMAHKLTRETHATITRLRRIRHLYAYLNRDRLQRPVRPPLWAQDPEEYAIARALLERNAYSIFARAP
jgi:hypothetical protein